MLANLEDIEARLGRVKARMEKKGRVMNLLSLNTALILIGEMNSDLKGYQNSLLEYHKMLIQNNKDVVKILRDTTLRDTTLGPKVVEQLQDIYYTAKNVDSLESISISKINILTNRVSICILQANDLISDLNYLNMSLKRSMWGAEEAPLFAARKEEHSQSYIDDAYNSLGRAWKVISIYMNSEWDTLSLSLIFLIFLLTWCLSSMRKIRKKINTTEILEPVHFLKRSIFAGCFMGFLTILPYFFATPPISFLHALEFIRLGLLSYLILPFIKNQYRAYWVAVSVLWVLFVVDDLLLEVAAGERWLLFAGGLTLAGICIKLIRDGNRFFKKIQESRITVALLIFTLAMIILSVIFNLTGRVTLAKIFAITAVQSLVAGITLKVFSAIILEAVYMQTEAFADSRISSLIDYEDISQRFRRGLWLLAGLIWTIILVRSLTMYNLLKRLLLAFFDAERTVGNMTFTYKTVAIFFLIIWASSLIASFIDFFFGHNSQQITGKKSKIGSMMLLIKLSIWSIGFLLAVAATGIPLDRLSFMLGALGVGIGFGLQNIVNNLVSGVIIAFERPIQIGDLIELGGRSGTVKEIGVRSSKLQSAEGADIIVPNGDLLSQQLINWTMQNRNRRVDFPISIPYKADLNVAKNLIIDQLKGNEGIMQTPEPKVMVQMFSEHTVDMSVVFWVADLSQAGSVRSGLMTSVYDALTQEGIMLDRG
jgi:small-conductance mechanosensitive channel